MEERRNELKIILINLIQGTDEKVCGFFAVQTLFGNVRILHKKT